MLCVICGSGAFHFQFEKDTYRIEKCSLCDLVQVTNIPPIQKIEECYDKGFFETYYGDLSSNNRKQRYEYLNFGNKLDQIEKRLGRRGRLLDVGCSFGFFLDAARQRGWSVAGVELSGYAAAYARDKFGLTVINKPVLDAQCDTKSFDVITMWYVVEHLPNPKDVLGHLRSLLKDDGMLVVSTANVDSYRARSEGKRWRMWIPPEHLLYFCPTTIRHLFNSCDLEIIGYETALPYERYFRRMGLYPLMNRLQISDNVVYYARKAAKPPPFAERQALLRIAVP